MPGITLSLPTPPETTRPLSAESVADAMPLRNCDPDEVDGYRLLALLGSGGMASAFYAEAPNGTPVVVKLLHPTDGAVEASCREYRLTRMIDADCTAPALGYGTSPAGAYLVTTFLPGYRSGSDGREDPVPTARLWTIAAALARALSAVHAGGVVHCDVKPSNLLTGHDDVRLIDFGIARLIGEPEPVPGTARCSRGWAAPEQLHARPAAPAMDVFAWGCVVAHLAGAHPFGDDGDAWAQRVMSGPADVTGIPTDLAALVGWALSRHPAHRPTAAELATLCLHDQPRYAGRHRPRRRAGNGADRPAPAVTRLDTARPDPLPCAATV